MRKLVTAAPSSLDSLVRFLGEGLNWPIPDDLDIEQVALPWSLDDLHLDPTRVARLDAIRQIRPLVHDQRFGVFVLDFHGGSLPIGAIRRVVDRLVSTARSSKNKGALPTWELDDLLFFCQAAGTERTLHIVALREVERRRIVRVTSWSRNSTEGRLELVIRRTVPELTWSAKDRGPALGGDIAAGGMLSYRYAINSADALARRMAEVARDVRDEVLGLYQVETESGPIRALFRDIRNQLIAELSPERFADVYAQTMVYGLLTARIAHPDHFKAQRNDLVLDLRNPLLEALYEEFTSSTAGVIDVDELGLGDLADALAETDIEDVLADFGAENTREDPVVHFYEDFLALYDPLQRIELGAFYTPTPIVRFMVRIVDEILVREFGLPDGIDSSTSWSEMEDHVPSLRRPTGIAGADRYFSVLDPATGTGTFIVEWLRHLRKRRLDGSSTSRTANEPSDPTGLEISLPPFSIAQLRLALEEREAGGGSSPGATVLLTDTLAAPESGEFLAYDDNAIAEQGALADAVKSSRRSTIVIGNPPYGDKAKGRGFYVEQPWGGRGPLLDDFTPDPSKGLGAHLKILRNLYVFFWRFAADQAWSTPPSRPGVVSLITSSAWLTGSVFERMREYLIKDAGADLWIVDLGGDQISGESGDENVFPIRTPVAIVTAVRTATPGDVGVVRRLALRGSALSKLENLEGLTLTDPRWEVWTGIPGEPFADATSKEWKQMPLLGDVMPFSANGVHQQRTWVNDASRSVLSRRWEEFIHAPQANKPVLMKETRSRKITATGRNVATDSRLGRLDVEVGEEPEEPVRYSFRFLDRQWLIPDSRIIDMPSPALWSVRSEKQFFVNEMHFQQLGPGPGIVVAPYIPNLHHFKGNSGGRAFPAWRDRRAIIPNVAPGLVELISSDFGEVVTGADLVAYTVGIASHGEYVARFSSELRTPGIRVPITMDPQAFRLVAGLGRRVIWIQTFGEQYAETQGALPGKPARLPLDAAWPEIVSPIGTLPMPEAMSYDERTATLSVGDGRIAGVPSNVFEYSVSGMNVLKKWFGYRKARPSTRYSSPLNDYVSSTWPHEWTDELVDLIHALALLIATEPEQAAALSQVMAGPVYTVDVLRAKLQWPPPESARGVLG